MKQLLKKSIKNLLNKKGLSLVNLNEYLNINKELDLNNKLIETYTDLKYLETDNSNPIEIVIFSMDRAIQLHALLESLYESIDFNPIIHILCKTNSVEHKNAYVEVQKLFSTKPLNFIYQEHGKTFKDQLIEILESIKSTRMFFLVDDIIFKNKLTLESLLKFDPRNYILSLRMHPKLSKSYTHNVAQKVPSSLITLEDNLYSWDWASGEYDWGYPLSVDGNVFLTREILLLSKYSDFKTPNSYEAILQKFNKYFLHRKGICFSESKILNLPINKVNTDTENLSGNIDTEFLLEQWNKGLTINAKPLWGFVNESAHQEVAISFKPR